jgi:hypothetical protein
MGITIMAGNPATIVYTKSACLFLTLNCELINCMSSLSVFAWNIFAPESLGYNVLKQLKVCSGPCLERITFVPLK